MNSIFNNDLVEEYMKKKYGDNYQQNAEQSYKDQLNTNRWAGLGSDIGDVIAGQRPGSGDAYFQNIAKRKQEPIEKMNAERKDLVDQYLKEKYFNAQLAEKEQDREFRKQQMDLSRQDRSAARQQQQEQKEENKSYRDEALREKYIQGLSGAIKGAQEPLNQFASLESTLGVPIETLKKDENGNLVDAQGKRVDLPGVSMPGFGRVSAYSSDARKLQSNIQKVLNAEIKDMSGATVTNNEMERIKQAFSTGKFNTEAEMIEALGEFKKAAIQELKSREAGYKPDIVQEYASRGGKTSLAYDVKKDVPKAIEKDFDQQEQESLARQKRIQELKAKRGG